MTDSAGLATRPWIAWFTTLGHLFGFNQTIQAGGTGQPQEIALNFLPPLIVTDNPANGSTDIGVAGLSRVATAQDAYLKLPDGTLIEWGKSDPVPAFNQATTSIAIVFPQAFTAIPNVTVSPDSSPDGSNSPLTVVPRDITTAGFNVDLQCGVIIGGGGASGITQQIHVNWQAMGW